MRSTGPALTADRLPLPYDLLWKHMPQEHRRFFERLDLYHEDTYCLCTHGGVSCSLVSPEQEEERTLLWGDQEFPDCCTGSRLVVYGHFSKKARLAGGVPRVVDTGNTGCLDTSRHGVVTALLLPRRRFFQSGSGGRVVQHDGS